MTEKLILGTVQFGISYGINNMTGRIRQEDVFSILNYAQSAGIHLLDTADAYGNAVDLIGKYHATFSSNKFQVITKFKSLEHQETNIEYFVKDSLSRLDTTYLFGCLYHSFGDYLKYKKSPQHLLSLKTIGKIKYLGVSIYTNEQFCIALEDENIDIIQLPYNLLDNQVQRGELMREAKLRGKIIHVRSVFLQGLFFKDINLLPSYLLPLRECLQRLRDLSNIYKIGIAELALNYVANNPLIDGVLIGVDNLPQLKINIQSLGKPLSTEIIEAINSISVPDTNLLNPSNWS